MEQAFKARLEAAGFNIDSALNRFMGNESMLVRYLNKFPAEKSYARLRETMAEGDQEAAVVAAHTLKGVCGTIGCDGMHQQVLRLEQLLRAGDWEAAVSLMSDISHIYDTLCAALEG